MLTEKILDQALDELPFGDPDEPFATLSAWRYCMCSGVEGLCGLVMNHPKHADGSFVRTGTIRWRNASMTWMRTNRTLYQLVLPR